MFNFGEGFMSVLLFPFLPPQGRSRSSRVTLCACILVSSVAIVSASVLRHPEFAEPIKNGTLQVGSDVEFSCDVRHLGTYRVAWSWKKDDDQKFIGIGIVKIVSDPRIKISRIQTSDDVTQFNLYIYNIKHEDAGTYHCSVNSNPMIEQIGTLDVVGDEYANGHNGKIVNGKSVANPPKPVRKGIDSSSSSSSLRIGENQQDDNINGQESPTKIPMLRLEEESSNINSSTITSNNEDLTRRSEDSSLFCIDLNEIWENARERIANFFSTVVRLTYSYFFS